MIYRKPETLWCITCRANRTFNHFGKDATFVCVICGDPNTSWPARGAHPILIDSHIEGYLAYLDAEARVIHSCAHTLAVERAVWAGFAESFKILREEITEALA